MVEVEIKFKDGTRIFYEEENGVKNRWIEYSYTPEEKEKIKKNPLIENGLADKLRKYKADRFHYLGVLYGMVRGMDETQKQQLYNDLKTLHDFVDTEYNPKVRSHKFLSTFGKYNPNNSVQCAEMFITIYLDMLDLEVGKSQYPNSLGKTMVLKTCEAVILKGVHYEEAAMMFSKKKQTKSNDYIFDNDYYYDNSNSRYEKYNGYNGFDDDTIDEAFDGRPDATWNAD